MVLRTSCSPVPWWEHPMSFGSYLRLLPGRGGRSRRLLLGKFSGSLHAEEIALTLEITSMGK